jgi:hypothetical protein
VNPGSFVRGFQQPTGDLVGEHRSRKVAILINLKGNEKRRREGFAFALEVTGIGPAGRFAWTDLRRESFIPRRPHYLMKLRL